MDKIDKRIMEILIQNCRVSHSTIASATHISKENVSYRIKKLQENGDYQQNVLFLDTRVFGFTRYQILLQFDSGLTTKKEIYERLKQYPNALWINTFVGLYDIQIIIDAKDNFDLNKQKNEIFALCDHKIKKYTTVANLHDIEFTQLTSDFMLETDFSKKDDYSFSKQLAPKSFPVNKEFTQYKPSRTDIEILSVLADNPQESLITIANKLDIDRKTVKKKISSLIEKNAIISFGAIPNLQKLGYVTYTLLIKLLPDTPLSVLRKPTYTLNNIFYAARFYGEYDFLIYINAKTPEELYASIEKFKQCVGEYIVHTDLIIMKDVLSWKHYTKGLHQKLLERV